MSKLKLLVIHGRSGCCFWRTLQPSEAMRKQGIAEVRYIDSRAMTSNELAEGLKWCDIASIRGLLGTEGLDTMRRYQSLGRKITTDYDDLHFNVSPFNPAYRNFGLEDVQAKDPTTGEVVYLWKDGKDGFDIKRNKIRFHAFQAILQECDLVTTTTVYLKNALSEVSGREDNIKVLPNALDYDQWKSLDVRDKYADEFRFGWAVSNSHGEDWLSFKPVLKEFLSTHPKAKFVVIGDTSFDLKGAMGPLANQIEWHPWSDLWEYHYPLRMAMLGLDVAIAPLSNFEFNKCKSPLKYAEYTSFGWPVIAQNMEPYSSHIIHGETGLLASSTQEWLGCLNSLYNNKDLRTKLHFNAQFSCKQMFDLKEISKEWHKAYQSTILGVNDANEQSLITTGSSSLSRIHDSSDIRPRPNQ